ncbi:MAG TPA: ORF6N domain-containing protein [Blastocatellia bacterium]|nr:ORF6N domain-containing protein [Blastocatellia bacterium]
MSTSQSLIPPERIERLILLVRDRRVILDADLAVLYGVTTKALNQAVKRNKKRFPQDFMFRLSKKEKIEVVTNCDHLGRLKFSPVLPYAFTEHGAIMLANVLSSDRAVEASVFVVRAFVHLREMFASSRQLSEKLAELERHIATHDKQIQAVFEAIRQLLTPPKTPRRQIGFHVKESRDGTLKRKGRH